jgi:hypothetical protein
VVCQHLGIAFRRRLTYCNIAINDTDDRQDADFFMEANQLVFAFQVVEAQDPDRQRGKEHNDLASGRIKTVPYDPEKGNAEDTADYQQHSPDSSHRGFSRLSQSFDRKDQSDTGDLTPTGNRHRAIEMQEASQSWPMAR